MTLTRETILSIPAGWELDALVAQSLDCKVFMEQWADKPRPRCDCNGANTTGERPHADPGDFFGYINHYSTDITAAWQVVAALNKKGIGVSVDSAKGETSVCLYDAEDLNIPPAYFLIEGAESAPLAICRAALLSTLQ